MILRSKPRPFDRDLLRYAEGSLNEVETALFEARLSSEPALRNDLRHLAEQAFAIGEHARNAQAIAEIATRSGVIGLPKRNLSSWKTQVPWAAAAVLVISLILLFLTKKSPASQPPAALVEVLEASGNASWITEDGSRTVILEKGMRLPAGAFESSTESALARLRYDDGTTLSFTGVSEATITKPSGKSLRIKRGQLTAQVTPQKDDSPMRIETPTALVTIVGTQFTLDVEPSKTGLAVSEGMVRMRRRSDSKEQEVSSGYRLTSTLESKAIFVPSAVPRMNETWTSDFTAMPGLTQGTWISPNKNYPRGAVAAKAFIAGLKPDGGIITHYGVSWSSEPGFAALNDTSTLSLKIRVKQAAAIQFMLVTRMTDGTYTGNFEGNPMPLQPTSNNEWQDMEIPLSRLQMTKYQYPKIVNGSMAHALIITTFQEDAGMEIAKIALQSSP